MLAHLPARSFFKLIIIKEAFSLTSSRRQLLAAYAEQQIISASK